MERLGESMRRFGELYGMYSDDMKLFEECHGNGVGKAQSRDIGSDLLVFGKLLEPMPWVDSER